MVAKYLLGSKPDRDYRVDWWQHLRDESRGIHYSALRTQEKRIALEDRVSRMLGLRSNAQPTESPSFLLRPYYRDIQKRERLKRVLICLYIWNPRLGFDPDLTHIAALVLEATGNERAAFHLLVGLHKRLQLYMYHSRDQTALKRDVRLVLATVEKLWPGVIVTFLQRQSQQTLIALVQDWLVSLLGKVWSTKDRPMKEILPYLDRLVMTADGGSDSRKFLRNMVACTLHLHVQELVHMGRPVLFFKNSTRTNKGLLELIDATIVPETCAWLNGTALLPIGLAAGYFGGLKVLPCLSILQASNSIAASLSVAAFPVVGSLAGAMALFQIGCSAGICLVRQVALDIQKAADAVEAEGEEEQRPEETVSLGAEQNLDAFFFRHVRDFVERSSVSMYSQFRVRAEAASSAWAAFAHMLPA